MTHLYVDQLCLARAEFERGLAGVNDPAAQQQFGSLNCLSWISGLAMLSRGDFNGSELWNQPTDQRSQAIHDPYQPARLDDLPAEAGLPDPGRFAGMPADWQPWDILAGNTYHHYSERRLDVQTWLQKR